MSKLTKKEAIQIALITLSVCIVTLGIMFLLTAMEAVIIFTGFANISNVIAKYAVVIVVMATGIMTFSNVSFSIENDKLRKAMVMGVTIFSTVLTVPLVYVFIAIFPAQSGLVGPVGEIMMLGKIVADFNLLIPSVGGLYVIYILLFIMSIIFISFPLLTGVLAIKGKTIKVGKMESGKFGVCLATLPVLAKRLELKSESVEEKNDVSDVVAVEGESEKLGEQDIEN